MEVVAAPSGGAPFHDHDVREWSRIDSITGALERARLETDRWSANTINASHKYGKVVDSRARTDADGALHQSARRQLEVFHSEVPGGRLQVVKTHTVSTSKWTSNTSSVKDGAFLGDSKDFENLQLSLNPLDLTSQKSKASVGRSVARRPPTRQRAKDLLHPTINTTDPLHHAHVTAATNLHRVSRLCHQIHESAVRQALGRRSPRPIVTEPTNSPRPTLSDRESGDGSVEIYEIESVSSENNINNTSNINGHTNLVRTKSSSSDDISLVPEKDTKGGEDLEDLEQLQSWRRTSKIRRSLQFPKQSQSVPIKPRDLPENTGSVKKLKEELEKGRRLNTALRNNSVDLDALDQILRSISNSSSDKYTDDTEIESPRKQKRNSFVTVESIQEVKGRLRRTNSPSNDIYQVNSKDEDPDDGIVTEETSSIKDNEMPLVEPSRVRSYVYGMEALLNKKPGIGTGSLESRVKLVPTNKNEDWYNRRKSYGFEKVHNHNDSSSSILFKNKNFVESSTDSGICRSTEIVVPIKRNGYKENESSSDEHNEFEHKYNELEHNKIQHIGQVKRLASNFNQDSSTAPTTKTDSWRTKNIPNWSNSNMEIKSTTITIPISKNNNVVDLSWNDSDKDQYKDVKRHSIAVDESKYVTKSIDNSYRRISLALNDQIRQEDDENNMRKTKKVEFCKTEVHFAADSGKVNIVATDDKPPPTQNFRRRRRNSGPSTENFNKNGLPLLHFGDTTYDKVLFSNSDNTSSESTYENLQSRVPAFALVTVNSNNSLNNSLNNEISEEEKKELTDNEIKGILKNKPIKPKPYHLGENVPFQDVGSISDEENKWGVRLKHVEKPDIPIWKSTVTVHNYNYLNQNDKENEPEFQKLLKNLRPIRKSDYSSDSDNKFFDSGKTPWPAPDMIESKGIETKGYSTKICLREGEATVVENEQFDRADQNIRPKIENLKKDSSNKTKSTDTSLIHHVQESTKKHSSINLVRPSSSPSPLKKTPILKPDLKPTEQLSSPSIVNRSKNIEVIKVNEDAESDNIKLSTVEKKITTKHISENMVLRQPKKSEMTYFGVNVSPKPVKKISHAVIRKENKLSDKPDLIQNHRKSLSPSRPRPRTPVNPLSNTKQKSPTPSRPKEKPPAKQLDEPIYENIKNKYGKEFDSTILDELTKAADQILLAVNGYTDEEIYTRISSDDEDDPEIKKLETILETKPVHQKSPSTRSIPITPKTKLKPASPTSSAESLTRKKIASDATTKPCYEKHRRRSEKAAEKSEHSSTKSASTKARRLQRASSREALLRSNGSSSEDLPAKIEPPRKPRLIKKTKAMQLTISNGLEMKKPSQNSVTKRKEEPTIKGEGRILNSLPEIRHKTAVSTIRSTSEKTARDRMKHRSEETRRNIHQQKESSRVMNSSRLDRDRSTKSTTGLHKETVTHRISTANIKKCYRTEGSTRH